MHEGNRREAPGRWAAAHLALLTLLLVLPAAAQTGQPLVPYDRFLAAVEEDRVAEATFSPDDIAWVERYGETEARLRTHRIPGLDVAPVVARLRSAGATLRGAPGQSFWPSVLLWIIPLSLLFYFWAVMARRSTGGTEYASFGRSRARRWEQGSTSVTFADVAGADEAVAELREVVDFLKRPEKYTVLGAHFPRGVLLVGPPGTGKTLLARATAGEAGVPFFSLSGAEFVEMFVGVGAARARDLFRQARAQAPCIVFIDEIDALGRSRSGARTPVPNEEREQTLNQLLVELDGFDSSAGVMLMAATNRPDLLDPALLRPGRFDRQVVVDRPDARGREAILRVHVHPVRLAADVDLRLLAARTSGFAGAELANVVNEAALLAVRAGRDEVTRHDLEEAVERVMAGLERKSRALIPREREVVAYHEMGHALLGMLLPHADPVQKVSIIPRGPAALGVTIQAPLEDRYLMTEAELRDRMTVLLGGRAAEAIAFGECSTGGADDLQRATAIARSMVTRFGMSAEIGPVALEDDGAGSGGPAALERTYSDETARQVDAAIRHLVEENDERAQALLRRYEVVLHHAAPQLLEHEVLDGEWLAHTLADHGLCRLTDPCGMRGRGRGVAQGEASPAV